MNEHDIIEAWINGNRADVRKCMKTKNKLFAVNLIPVFVGQFGYKYHNAISEIRAMLEVRA
jgi:hypothetical protein